MVAAGRIAGCGDRNAVVVGGAGRGELRQEPAIHKLVVQYDWVAGWIGAVRNCEAAPQRPRIDRSEQQSAGLGIDSDHLHVVVRTNRSVGVPGLTRKPNVLKLSWLLRPSKLANVAGMADTVAGCDSWDWLCPRKNHDPGRQAHAQAVFPARSSMAIPCFSEEDFGELVRRQTPLRWKILVMQRG